MENMSQRAAMLLCVGGLGAVNCSTDGASDVSAGNLEEVGLHGAVKKNFEFADMKACVERTQYAAGMVLREELTCKPIGSRDSIVSLVASADYDERGEKSTAVAVARRGGYYSVDYNGWDDVSVSSNREWVYKECKRLVDEYGRPYVADDDF